MASREEEKRLRREEREKTQAAAAASQSRAKRLQYLIGALIAIAAVVVVVLLVTGGSDDGAGGGTPTTADDGPTAAIPVPSERDLDKAAKAAGCQLLNPPIEGSSHVDGKVDYKSVPPTSGNHNATPALDGVYATGDEPAPENWVHALEHGRIVFQYKPGTPAKTVSQLETLANEPLNGKNAYKVLLLQNKTNMDDFAVAASAWGHAIVCKNTSEAMFDALRDFRVKYVDKGPEPGIPPNN
jgi:hypothetical protein